MPAIGFTVMKEKIVSGDKRQTIRLARKRPIKIGDTLYLYWHLRRKDCQLLRVEKCIFSVRWPWQNFCFDDDIAQRDGFKDSKEMREWFLKKYGDQLKPDTLCDVIRW